MPMSPRLLRPRASGGFDPRSLTGLALWLDAADSTTVTLNSGVEEWRDKSGNARHFSQSTANNRPAYTGSINGRLALSFDGTNDSLSRSGVANADLTTAAGASVFIVYSVNSDTIYSVYFNGGGQPGQDHRDRFSDGNSYGALFRFARLAGVINNQLPSTGAAIYGAVTTDSAYSLRLNGAEALSTSSSFFLTNYRTATNQTYTLGVGPVLDYLNGNIGEVLSYNRPLTATEITAVEQYLRRKWGI
jgi:hypothetical protein